MTLIKYAGQRCPSRRHYPDGRLPASERTAELPGHQALQHSCDYDTVPRDRVLQSIREQQLRIQAMFNLTNALSADSIPSAGRKGKPAKDWGSDAHFIALKAMPVNEDAWYASEETFTDNKLAQKFQSKIAQYAKAGAGTFKTRNRGGKVYICKIAAEYEQQRGVNEA